MTARKSGHEKPVPRDAPVKVKHPARLRGDHPKGPTRIVPMFIDIPSHIRREVPEMLFWRLRTLYGPEVALRLAIGALGWSDRLALAEHFLRYEATQGNGQNVLLAEVHALLMGFVRMLTVEDPGGAATCKASPTSIENRAWERLGAFIRGWMAREEVA